VEDENLNIRDQNIVKVVFPETGDWSIKLKLDRYKAAQTESAYAIGLVSFVVVLLVSFSYSFNDAVNITVVQPIQRIMDKLKETASLVMSSVQMMNPDEEDEDEDGTDETDLLEVMVNKLARMVQNTMGQTEQIADGEMGSWLNHEYSEVHRSSGGPQEIQAKAASAVEKHKRATLVTKAAQMCVSADVINSFEFDPLSQKPDELAACVIYMFEYHKLPHEFDIEEKTLMNFVKEVQKGYKTDPTYHNWFHGVDVLHTTWRILNMIHADAFMSKLELFASVVSSVAHDVGHFGFNNGYLVKARHQLAFQHNDKSPLENMHCATLYQILSMEECNIMRALSDSDWADCRKQILTCILNTDMATHAKTTGNMKNFYELNGAQVTQFVRDVAEGQSATVPECLADSVNRLLLQEAILHAADLSNPVKPIGTYKKWAERVMEEFFTQGDTEKGQGMTVSPMCARDPEVIPKAQVGFMEFVIAPYYITFFQLFPVQLVELASNLKNNHAYYVDEQIKKDGDPEGKLAQKKQGFADRFAFMPFDLVI